MTTTESAPKPETKPVRGPNSREWLRTFFENDFAPGKATDQSRKLHVRAINRFEKFLGRQARLVDLSQPNLEQFGRWLADQGYGQRSCAAGPGSLRSIWKFAADVGRLRNPPADHRKPFEKEWASAAEHRGSVTTLRQLATRTDRREKTICVAINQLHRFLDREPLISDVAPELLEKWAESLIVDGWLPESAGELVGTLRQFARFGQPGRPTGLLGASRVSESPTLLDLLARYAEGRDIEKGSMKSLRAAVRGFGDYLRRPACLSDLSDDAVNAWLAAELESVGRRTVRNKRAGVLTLWRWCYAEKLVDSPPLRVRPVNAPLAPPAAYTVDQVRQLLKACETLDDKFCRGSVPRRLLYRALLLVLYDSGIRPGDAMRLHWANIRGGFLQMTQHKTGWPITRPLHPATIAALAKIRVKNEPRIFAAHTSLGTLRFVFRTLKSAANLSAGSPKWLRRACATAIAEIHGDEAAGRALGHKTAGLARKHYIDESQLTASRELLPPPLETEST